MRRKALQLNLFLDVVWPNGRTLQQPGHAHLADGDRTVCGRPRVGFSASKQLLLAGADALMCRSCRRALRQHGTDPFIVEVHRGILTATRTKT